MERETQDVHADVIELGTATVETKGPIGILDDPGVGEQFFAGIADD